MILDLRQSGNKFIYREIINGKALKNTIDFSQKLFLKTKSETKYKGFISDDNLKEFSFNNFHEYLNFKKKYKDSGRLYGDIAPYVSELSKEKQDLSELKNVNGWALDIEVYAKKEFPSPDKAQKFPIVAISIYSILNKKAYTFVYDIYNKCTLTSNDKREINIYSDERQMMNGFLTFWKSNIQDIHVLTGWNIKGYDIPYIIRRLNYLYEDDCEVISNETLKLSPFKNVYLKMNNFSKDFNYSITGMPVLDYMEIFKKYYTKPLPSYKLENVAQHVLGYGKLDHSEFKSFPEFYEKDINKYVEYNYLDTKVVGDIDDKEKFLNLCYTVAKICKINFEDVLSPIRCWESLIYNELLKDNIIIPPRKHNARGNFLGAYVKEPMTGLLNYIISYDLDALYPNTIIAMNVSPETLVENKYSQEASIDGFIKNHIPKEDDYIIDPAGNYFTKEKVGIVPKLMDKLYKERIKTKKEMKEITKEIEKLKELL